VPSFAALLHRPAEVSDQALSRGFAVALAGWEVPRAHLLVTPLPALPGWSVAFYASGIALPEESFEHVVELFEDELSPAVAVIDAALEEGLRVGASEPVVLTLVYGEDVLHDEAWRVTSTGFERWFVREGDVGVERGHETEAGADVGLFDPGSRPDGDAPPDADAEAVADAAIERAARPHRGSTALSAILGAPVLSALMGALFMADRRVELRLVAPDAASIAAETGRLVRALRRVVGRGAFVAPTIAGAPQPAAHAAFVATYDWEDPHDPADFYRELAIGRIVGTLHFLRAPEIAAAAAELVGASAGSPRLYPLARLSGSALGRGEGGLLVALGADGAELVVVRAVGRDRVALAGPTFGELLRYLSLGWSRRSDAEEDLIGALMLRARLRVSPDETRGG
jgi:hypothetical protein